MPNVYNIPADQTFVQTFVKFFLEQESDIKNLTKHLILLPSERSVRSLKNAFLQLRDGQPMLLPQIGTLGNIDEDALALSFIGGGFAIEELNLPKAMPKTMRHFMFIRMVLAQYKGDISISHATGLAQALGHLLDHIYTQNLDIRDLTNIVPDNFSEYWQITLDFLKILSEEWPKILKDNNMIDEADRRNRLLLSLSNFWNHANPNRTVWGIGSTGSIPASSALLKTIASFRQGGIVLPGLDMDMHAEEWENLENTHPQYNLKNLLDSIGIKRNAVLNIEKAKPASPKIEIARKIMSPHFEDLPETDAHDFRLKLKTLCQDSLFIEAKNEEEEAKVIAALMRETLEIPERTCAVVTPDRTLAKRIKTHLKRWNILIDDTAGEPLDQTSCGSFFLSFLDACNNQSAVDILAFLKHPLFQFDTTSPQIDELVLYIEKNIFCARNPNPNACKSIDTHINDTDRNLYPPGDFIASLCDHLTSHDRLKVFDSSYNFNDLLRMHIGSLEDLLSGSKVSPASLWQYEDGESLSEFLQMMLQYGDLLPPMNLHDYVQFIRDNMRGHVVRKKFGQHPRLQIMGQIEARMVEADFIIMAGLNEGTWPPNSNYDPWLSSTMRSEFGLPGLEEAIGLSAHDFVQGFCKKNIALSRSLKQDGALSVPSRWLKQLHMIFNKYDIDATDLQNDALEWVRNIDVPDHVEPQKRPAPTPPVSTRPDSLSVTDIKTWIADPYAIYAKKILYFKPLEEISAKHDAAYYGTILHEIFERSVSDQASALNKDDLFSAAETVLDLYHMPHNLRVLWWVRFEKIVDWIVKFQQERNHEVLKLHHEVKGAIEIDGFTLLARADRIDECKSGNILIDYKTGGTYTKTSFMQNLQLPLQALILEKNGFENIKKDQLVEMGYLVLKGSYTDTGKYIQVSRNDILKMAAETESILKNMISLFRDEKTAYTSLPDALNIPRFQNYAHLSRVQEWGIADLSADAEEGGYE